MITKLFYIFLIVILNNVYCVFAQRNEIGLTSFLYKGYSSNYQSEEKELQIYFAEKRKLIQITPILQFNHLSTHSLEWKLQYGFFTQTDKGNSYSNYGFTNSKVTFTVNGLSKSHFIAIGCSQRYTLNKLLLSSGIYIPIEINYFNKGIITFNEYTITDTNFYFRQITTIAPLIINTGVYFNQNFCYPLAKNFSIGIDFNTGLAASLLNGTKTTIDEQNYLLLNQRNIIITKDTYQNSIFINLNFISTVAIKYTLSPRKIKNYKTYNN